MTFPQQLQLFAGAAFAGATYCFATRFLDAPKGEDAFSKHTAQQQKEHPVSGMHAPYIPSDSQQEFFMRHFSVYSHLLPTSLAALHEKRALKTPVRFLPLEECPVKEFKGAKTVVVGGPPALVSSINERECTYINDSRQQPIADGSAFHLEWDSPSEGPTGYRPSQFMLQQMVRLFVPQTIARAEKTGLFPWRSLDWAGWITRPTKWLEGARIALAFEKATRSLSDPAKKAKVYQEVAARSRENQKFYEELNQRVGAELFLPGSGSVIVARTQEEEQDLLSLKADLELEGRELCLLSKEALQKRFGFIPEGRLFAEKTHDKILNPNYMKILTKRIESLGGKVVNGVLDTIYMDKEREVGVVKYKTAQGQEHYLPFSHLILSLGSQRLIDKNNKPLFDVVSARGVSALAIAYVPEGTSLPPAIVCGATNHVTRLSDPISVEREDKKRYSAYLVRMTCGACITPSVNEEENANYDAVAATGLISAVRQTLGCNLEVFAVYGCNRQVSQHGQTHWLSPLKTDGTDSLLAPRGQKHDSGTSRPNDRIAIQMGAGGGGLTQAPSQPANPDEFLDAFQAFKIADNKV